MTRRELLLGSLAASAAVPGRKTLVVLVDGFGPEYVDRSEMPNLRRLRESGVYKVGKAVIPTVTNVNNVSVVTGSFPERHGVTTNFFHDRKTGVSQPMESHEFILRPTLFEVYSKLGRKTALVSSKDKVRTLCSRGASIVVSAEKPEREWIDAVGPQENMYSAPVNFWTFRAARHILKTRGVDLMYLSTTDYMMHTYPPESEQSKAHLHELDRLLGDIVSDHKDLELFLTADHGMNAKQTVLDPAAILRGKGVAGEALSLVKDKHKVHHADIGGCTYVYLQNRADLAKAMDVFRGVPGIEEVLDQRTAAKQFHLMPDRIGDIVLLAAKDAAFGDPAAWKPGLRTHGSRHEQSVPLLAWPKNAAPAKLEFNLDLTRDKFTTH